MVRLASAFSLAAILALVAAGGSSAGPTVELVSVTANGEQADNGSFNIPTTSANGRFVAFESAASNLADKDGLGWDVFVKDMTTGAVTLASAAATAEPNGSSSWARISADGHFVAFASNASNLVSNDLNGVDDIFVRDLVRDKTIRVSVYSDGREGSGESISPSISRTGRFIAFYSLTSFSPLDTNRFYNIYLHDFKTGRTRLASRALDGGAANGHSDDPSLSASGRYVSFGSSASNLVEGDTNSEPDSADDRPFDVFVFDRRTGSVRRASVASDGTQSDGYSDGSSLSASGSWVVFASTATNLVDDDTNGRQDVFLHNLKTAKTVRVSVAADGSEASNGADAANAPAISQRGAVIVFFSTSRLIPSDTDDLGDAYALLRGRTLVRLSADEAGGNSDLGGGYPSISTRGGFAVFTSGSSELVSDDTNGTSDVFRATILDR